MALSNFAEKHSSLSFAFGLAVAGVMIAATSATIVLAPSLTPLFGIVGGLLACELGTECAGGVSGTRNMLGNFRKALATAKVR